MTNSLRIFFVGGLTSYRALFGWLTPWVYIPTLLVVPVFQMLLFAYIGRAAAYQNDAFFVVGNSLQSAALPCIFAMGHTISGERYQQTLSCILATPARRVPLFLGRALPVIGNGVLVSGFTLVAGVLLLDFDPAVESLPSLAVVVVATSFACTGMGLLNGGIGLRVRETSVLSNVLLGLLLIFCGVNVPLDDLPGWMSTIAQGLPLTHGIEAARRVVGGEALGDVGGLVGTELLIGVLYLGLGFSVLRFFEERSRRHATLERA
jgi:ABC-2 type transport system permease protein